MGTQRTVLRFLAGCAAMAAITMVAFTTLASAREADRPEGPEGEALEVSGDFTGTTQVSGVRCMLNVVVDGEGEWTSLGPGTITMDFCTYYTNDPVRFTISDATFAITTDEGTLSGSMTGWNDAGQPSPAGEFPYRFELEVDGGTGALAEATGTLTAEGMFGPAGMTVSGSISGTVTLPPPDASSREDCLHGGWRDVVDDDGEPFRNQGRCVSFVRRP